jgi:hypothetical protein
MKWHHIMDIQPEDGERIIQLDHPYYGHCTIGFRDYVRACSFEELLEYYQDNDLPKPNFWWMYEKDFDFPKEIKHLIVDK